MTLWDAIQSDFFTFWSLQKRVDADSSFDVPYIGVNVEITREFWGTVQFDPYCRTLGADGLEQEANVAVSVVWVWDRDLDIDFTPNRPITRVCNSANAFHILDSTPYFVISSSKSQLTASADLNIGELSPPLDPWPVHHRGYPVIIQGHKASDMLLSSDYVPCFEKRKCHYG